MTPVRWWWLLAAIVSFALGAARAMAPGPAAGFVSESRRVVGTAGEPMFETRVVSTGATPAVHAATAVALESGGIRAAWYGGTREGAKDVAIYTSVFDPRSGGWRDERVVSDRWQTARDVGRYVKKLGNPVLARDGTGRVWLYYVSVSIGGWSGSAVNARVSDDEGRTFSRARRLSTSPFLNLSTLVRGPAVPLAGGGVALPVYHELVGKFSELATLDAQGRVRDKARISSGRTSLQPVLVVDDDRRARAYLRRSGSSPPRVLTSVTEDAGRTWSRPSPTALPNPDAAVAAIRLASGEVLMAFNDSEVDRANLSLALSAGGEDFDVVRALPPPERLEDRAQRFAYPWLLQTVDGVVHLFYTWDRAKIVHVRFNRSWLLQTQ